jgi:hypothetical protein
MSKPRRPAPAKLVIGCFTRDKGTLEDVAHKLSESFGPPDVISPWLPFEHTDYYASEMGSPLFRRLMAFRELIQPDTLADIKLLANDLEGQFSTHGKRLVNIDPGYLLAERFVLATGKNYAHRIYLRAGIYADLTLIYRKSRFHQLDWTYPDYAGEAIIDFLVSVRDRYLRQLREQLKGSKVNWSV